MLRRDFIMVQIEELGKVLAQIIGLRNNDAARQIPPLVQVVYNSLHLDHTVLMNTDPDEIRRNLDKDDGGGIQRMEIAVKTLIEESLLYPSQQQAMLERAKFLLEYLQKNDRTFSLERIILLEEINKLLNRG